MEFRQLLYMLKIAEERSFSKAAQKLYITQPSLSHYISNLEKQLGVKLFDRTTSPLTLTYAGEIFAEKARNILNQHDELLLQLKDIADFKRGRLTIGIAPLRGADVLPKILPIFCKKFPGIEINLIQENSKKLIELTSNGTLDLSILPLYTEAKLLTYEIIQHDELLISIHPKHPVLKKVTTLPGKPYPQISLELLKEERFIIPKKTNLLRPLIDDLFKQVNYSPKILLETNSMNTVCSLVMSELGVGFWFSTLNEIYQTIEHPVHCSLINPKPIRPIVIAYKTGKYISKVEHEFIAITKAALT